MLVRLVELGGGIVDDDGVRRRCTGAARLLGSCGRLRRDLLEGVQRPEGFKLGSGLGLKGNARGLMHALQKKMYRSGKMYFHPNDDEVLPPTDKVEMVELGTSRDLSQLIEYTSKPSLTGLGHINEHLYGSLCGSLEKRKGRASTNIDYLINGGIQRLCSPVIFSGKSSLCLRCCSVHLRSLTIYPSFQISFSDADVVICSGNQLPSSSLPAISARTQPHFPVPNLIPLPSPSGLISLAPSAMNPTRNIPSPIIPSGELYQSGRSHLQSQSSSRLVLLDPFQLGLQLRRAENSWPAASFRKNTSEAEQRSNEAECRIRSRINNFINILPVGVENGVRPLGTLKKATEYLVEMNQEAVETILICKEDVWNNQELRDLVQEYFDNSLQILDFCNAVVRLQKRFPLIKLHIHGVLQRYDEGNEKEEVGEKKYLRTLEGLKSFIVLGDSLTEEFSNLFKSVHSQQTQMLEKLKKLKKKFDMKLKCARVCRAVSRIIFFVAAAAVIICSMVNKSIPSAAAHLITSMETMIDSGWKHYQDILERQSQVLTSMDKGTFCTIQELQNIRVSVNQLESLMGTLFGSADMALKDEGQVGRVMKIIRKELDSFEKLDKCIQELSEHTDSCRRRIIEARKEVVSISIYVKKGNADFASWIL
ncbi:hypothetical protein HHK36_010083 [Tetracentron sinense]|uniref:Uncharacterized protein n=1 Tax=Tetracentron sinense TaxID=13715 RepID=A0A835DI52_TETSI|nr:hypothetical protein HHK36_010083 [Tetracentron sinense]